jgi:hypothetical protein
MVEIRPAGLAKPSYAAWPTLIFGVKTGLGSTSTGRFAGAIEIGLMVRALARSKPAGLIHSPGHSVWKSTMRLAAAWTLPGAGSPRLHAMSSRLLAMLTSTIATIGMLTTTAMMNIAIIIACLLAVS